MLKIREKLQTYALPALILLLYLLITIFSLTRSNFLAITLETFSQAQLLVLAMLLFGLLCSWLIMIYIKPTINKFLKIIIPLVLLLGLITPPLLSNDIPAYFLNAQIIYSENKNPYQTPLKSIVMPAELQSIWWVNFPSPYGPIFLLLLLLPWLISFSYLFIFIYTYKLLALVAFIAAYWLFSKLRQKNNAPPYFDLLFLLNPALLINLVVEGHNEVFIILFLLLFLYFKANTFKSLLYISAATLIKFTALVIWPLAWFKDQKLNLRSFVYSSLSLLIICLLFFSLAKLSPLNFIKQNIFFINSFCFYVCPPFDRLIGFLNANIISQVKIIGFALVYSAITYWFLFKKHDPLKFIVWSFVVLFFIQTKWLTPWYTIIIIPFSLLLNNKKYLLLTAVITAYSLLHYLRLI